ncbi:TPA: hypothetical protein DCX16_01160 [bacterium]|nr:hypothetical protein [bacterium]
MDFKEKDKKVRSVLVKRLFLLKEGLDEVLRGLDDECRLNESKKVLSLIKVVDETCDAIRFTNYGYTDVVLSDEERIEEKQREMFSVLEEVEKKLKVSPKDSDFLLHIKNAEEGVNYLKSIHQEIESMVTALIPKRKKRFLEEVE